MEVRSYLPSDYQQLKAIYIDSSTYGGVFDEARDSEEKLNKKIESDSDAILVAEDNDKLVGSVSLIEDGRVAWLFRFAVLDNNSEALKALEERAIEVLKKRGHNQVIVYSPTGNAELDSRYENLGFNKGSDYAAFWKEI